ncbi:hypothetical protein [Microvirga soli]|nr:hypothetical protein [Microvirga soli]
MLVTGADFAAVGVRMYGFTYTTRHTLAWATSGPLIFAFFARNVTGA